MRTLPVLLATLLLAPLAAAQDEDPFSQHVRAALDGEIRTEAERARDANRRPVETLAFFGLREEMRVLELLPGGGWYTKLLAPALRERGKLYVGLGTARVKERLLGQEGFDRVEVVAADVSLQPTDRRGIFDLAPFSFGVQGLDAALTFRNLHNLTPEARARLNRAVFEALRGGGLYGVVDHTRRHMEPDGPENRRRTDPVQILQEGLEAGFEFVGWSDLHHRPDDELRYEVGRKTVTGNTDRFTFLFRKPE